jgi:hypothetical protein
MSEYKTFAVAVSVMVVMSTAFSYASPTAPQRSEAIVLRGVDSQNVRPFTLRRDSDVSWTCGGCRGSNFVFSTRQDIPVNALGPTRGGSFLERGRYTGVSVTATGAWRITIKPAPARPVRSRYVLTGVDGRNLRPFTLKRDSNITWTCGGCARSNFIVSTDQDIPVNSLSRTRGRSFLERGRYTGVSVTASGAWRIVIG